MEPIVKSLDEVEAYFKSLHTLPTLVGKAIRQAFNEVIDGGRTKRYHYDQLEKEEKTYIGKKVEIILRDALGLPKGSICDLNIKGIEVDIKWSKTGSWMIPRENNNQICLLATATDNEEQATFSLGLIRATDAVLTKGANQDQKRTISRLGKKQIRWLHQDHPMPPNFLLQLPSDIREQILSQEGGQARVNELFRLVLGRPIPREALESIGNQRDTAKRVRDARKHLKPEGIIILSGRYDRAEAQRLGLPIPGQDEFISYTTKR